MAEKQNSFDLEAYISKYRGFGKTARLKFIVVNSEELRVAALRLLFKEIKKGKNVELYRQVFELAEAFKLTGGEIEEACLDTAWIAEVEELGRSKFAMLKRDLDTFKSVQVQQSIRTATKYIGDFYYDRGEYENALKSYKKTSEYSRNVDHVGEVDGNIIRAQVALGFFADVEQQVAKSEQVHKDIKKEVVMSRLKCYSGLACLVAGNYRAAASKFCAAKMDAEGQFQVDMAETLSMDDIAIYGGLCGLAAFSRSELDKEIISSSSFREFLELVPEVRELVNDFYNSEYTSCLNYLERLKPDLELDMYLAEHLKALYGEIRNRGIIQYCTPFMSVDLKIMAQAFNTTALHMIEEVASLIVTNKIPARIDTEKQILYRKQKDNKRNAYNQALLQGQTMFSEVEVVLMRMQLSMQNLRIEPVDRRRAMP